MDGEVGDVLCRVGGAHRVGNLHAAAQGLPRLVCVHPPLPPLVEPRAKHNAIVLSSIQPLQSQRDFLIAAYRGILELALDVRTYCWLYVHALQTNTLHCVASYLSPLFAYGEWVNLAIVSAWHVVLCTHFFDSKRTDFTLSSS